MPTLYSADDLAQIKQGYKDTMDTYSNNIVTLKIAGGSVDRSNEDRGDIAYTDYAFAAIVIFAKVAKEEDPSLGGSVDVTKAEVIVHTDTLFSLNLLDAGNNCIANETTDLMLIDGKIYRIKEIAMQGHLEGTRQVKCHFQCQIEKAFYP